MLIIDSSIEPNNAATKPDTANPGTIFPMSQNKRAFITKVNNPKVSRLIGSVKSNNRGFIVIFTIPISNAAHNAGIKPARLTPGTTQATKSKDRAKNTHLRRIYNMLFFPFFE